MPPTFTDLMVWSMPSALPPGISPMTSLNPDNVNDRRTR